MKTKDLIQLGVPEGEALRRAHEFMMSYRASGADMSQLENEVAAIVAAPETFLNDPMRESLARALYQPAFKQRATLAPWKQWGSGLEAEAVKQMANACALPISMAGALMPDAHVGYGLPIGGVLATDNVVIPYAVGVDIACRMRLTVFDRPASTIAGARAAPPPRTPGSARRAPVRTGSSSPAVPNPSPTRTGSSGQQTSPERHPTWPTCRESRGPDDEIHCGSMYPHMPTMCRRGNRATAGLHVCMAHSVS